MEKFSKEMIAGFVKFMSVVAISANSGRPESYPGNLQKNYVGFAKETAELHVELIAKALDFEVEAVLLYLSADEIGLAVAMAESKDSATFAKSHAEFEGSSLNDLLKEMSKHRTQDLVDYLNFCHEKLAQATKRIVMVA